jgi:hypothetical protein
MQLLIWLAILLLIGLVKALPIVFRIFCRNCIAAFVTPTGHRKYGEYEESESYSSLVKEGFGVQPRWASDSVAKIKKA